MMDEAPFCNNYVANLICQTKDGRYELSISASIEMGAPEAKQREIAEIAAIHFQDGKIIVERKCGRRDELPDRMTLVSDLTEVKEKGVKARWNYRPADLRHLERQVLIILDADVRSVIFDPMGEHSEEAMAIIAAARG